MPTLCFSHHSHVLSYFYDQQTGHLLYLNATKIITTIIAKRKKKKRKEKRQSRCDVSGTRDARNDISFLNRASRSHALNLMNGILVSGYRDDFIAVVSFLAPKFCLSRQDLMTERLAWRFGVRKQRSRSRIGVDLRAWEKLHWLPRVSLYEAITAWHRI